MGEDTTGRLDEAELFARLIDTVFEINGHVHTDREYDKAFAALHGLGWSAVYTGDKVPTLGERNGAVHLFRQLNIALGRGLMDEAAMRQRRLRAIGWDIRRYLDPRLPEASPVSLTVDEVLVVRRIMGTLPPVKCGWRGVLDPTLDLAAREACVDKLIELGIVVAE